jgi:hypothetical protein
MFSTIRTAFRRTTRLMARSFERYGEAFSYVDEHGYPQVLPPW